MEIMSSIFYKDEEDTVNTIEQFHFFGESESNQEIRSFHPLEYNESIVIRMKHSSYAYSDFYRRQCEITFKFLAKNNNEIIRFTVIPGAAEFQLACAKQEVDIVTFPENSYKKYYEFIIVFSSVGAMLFYMQDLYIKSTRCINALTEITKFQHIANNTKDFEVMLEVGAEKARVPANWHIVRHIPVNHKFIIKYFPDLKNIFSIRLTDRNGITAITITVDYKAGIVYARRPRLDTKDQLCINFGDTLEFTGLLTTRIQIAILPYIYQIGILLEKGKRNIWCVAPYHHLSPYDIQQAIIDSTNKNFVAYANYVVLF